MDIHTLIDKLEDLASQGRSVPLTRNVIVDEDRLLDIIDQMRVSIPDEINRGKQILAQRDRILAQASEEQARTIEIANEKKEQLISASEITIDAKKRADQIVSQAMTEAEMIKREADKYTLEKLRQLEAEMELALNQVRNGIHHIQRDQGGDN